MKRRYIEMLCAIGIVVAGIAGVLMQCGLFSETGFVPGNMGLLSSVSTILLVIYEIFEIRYLRKHRTGVFFAYLKCSTFLLFTFQFLIGQILFRSMYQSAVGDLKTAYLLLHGVLPVLVVVDWLGGEKGHFYWQFLLSSCLLPVLYLIVVMIVGQQTHWYPYILLNVKVIGIWAVLQSILFLAFLYVVYACVVIGIDRILCAKSKTQQNRN